MQSRSSAVAVIADCTGYEVWYIHRLLTGNSCDQHQYLLIYSFKLKSAFDAGSHPFAVLFCG